MKKNHSVFCIAEVGSNFNNDLILAKEYVNACAEAGANAVKFQTLKKDLIISPLAKSGNKIISYPVYDIFGSLELPESWHYLLKEEADKAGIEFISTPFYIEAVDLLTDVGVDKIKIASGDITFYPLLEKIGRSGKNIILSTGASTNNEIYNAIDVLKKNGSGSITLLHCVSNYPPKWSEMNIKSIPLMIEEFNTSVGLSDHSPGITIPLASVAIGASVIEKHVTFDRSLQGPDHEFSMTVGEFSEMVSQIRNLEEALGTGWKRPSSEEIPRVKRIRRGMYDCKTRKPTSDPENAIWLRPEHDVFL